MKISARTLVGLGAVLVLGAIFIWRIDFSGTPDSNRGMNDKVAGLQPSTDQHEQVEPSHARQILDTAGSSVVKLEKLDAVPTIRTGSPVIRGKSIVPLPGGKTVTLDIKNGLETLRVRPNAAFTRFLVSKETPRKWSIYDDQGDLVESLPSVTTILPGLEDVASIQWTWGHENTLLAMAELYEKRDPSIPKYPEEDGVPSEVHIYRYEIDSQTVKRLKLPSEGLPRLEGVSNDGALIISIVGTDGDYWGPRAQESISAYRIGENP